jgi:rare lipoprotein A
LLCALVLGVPSAASSAERGVASFYHYSHFGGLTAAHKSLPKGTNVRVLNLDNGRNTAVRIVDRGPYVRGRILDVSPDAATALGFQKSGLAHVEIDPIP